MRYQDLQYGTPSRLPVNPHSIGGLLKSIMCLLPLREVSIYDSEGSARDLCGLTQEHTESESQSLLRREPTTASKPARSEPIKPGTSKHSDPKHKHSGSKDG